MSAQEGLAASLRQFRQSFTDEAADALEAKDARITSLESELAEARVLVADVKSINKTFSECISTQANDMVALCEQRDGLRADNARQKQALEAIANLPGVDLEGSDEEVNERQAERASKAFDIARAALARHEQPAPTMTAEQMREACAKLCAEWSLSILKSPLYADNVIDIAHAEEIANSIPREIAIAIRALPASPGKGGGV